jgi:hypothetical protein
MLGNLVVHDVAHTVLFRGMDSGAAAPERPALSAPAPVRPAPTTYEPLAARLGLGLGIGNLGASAGSFVQLDAWPRRVFGLGLDASAAGSAWDHSSGSLVAARGRVALRGQSGRGMFMVGFAGGLGWRVYHHENWSERAPDPEAIEICLGGTCHDKESESRGSGFVPALAFDFDFCHERLGMRIGMRIGWGLRIEVADELFIVTLGGVFGT